jgi:hypothetical protein
VQLLGAKYDEATLSLEESLWDVEKTVGGVALPRSRKRWPCSARLFQHLLRRESGNKTLLGAAIKSEKLKQGVFARLGPTGEALSIVPRQATRLLIYDFPRTVRKIMPARSPITTRKRSIPAMGNG